MTKPEEDRPLIVAAEERTREIAARCSTVRRACRAVGFTPGSSHERIAVLIALVAGEETLRRSVSDLAEDPEVGVSPRQVRRAMRDLEEVGFITAELEPQLPVRRRGRPVQVWQLTLVIEAVRDVVIQANRWESEQRSRGAVNTSSDFSAPSRPPGGVDAASSRRDGGVEAASRRHRGFYTVCPPNNPLTQDPPSPFPAEPDAEVEDGVDHLRGKVPEVVHDASDHPDASDQVPHDTPVTRAATEPTARRLCRSLGWPRENLETLWRAAAAFDAGLLSEHQVADAVHVTTMQPRRTVVGYFRGVLADHVGGPDALTRLLTRVRMRGGFPEHPPPRDGPERLPAPLRRVPAGDVRHDSDESMNRRREAMLADLAACIHSES